MNIGVILNDQQLIIIHQLITFGNDVNVILFEKKATLFMQTKWLFNNYLAISSKLTSLRER